MKTITVYVRGGVVQDVQIPKGLDVTVDVKDYDVDGVDPIFLQYDSDSQKFPYILSCFI